MSKEQAKFPYLAVGISILLGCLFLVFFFLAVSNEPDYMPGNQQQHTQQHAFKTAPAMAPSTTQNVGSESNSQDHMQMNMDMEQHQHTDSAAH